jgi:hypothetical protein
MDSATIRQHGSSQTPDSAGFRSPAPLRRAPRPLDYPLFFIGVPVGLAIVFSLVGTRLTYGMPYFDALIYMMLHMFVAWWSVNLGAAIVKWCFRSWQPPAIAVCILGLLIALIPAAFLFQMMGDFYATLYPVFATNRQDSVVPNWDLPYLVHFIRYSLPVLPTFLAGVYGYRYATGVDWYGYRRQPVPAKNLAEAEPTGSHEEAARQATAKLIAGSKLPPEAHIIAIKAEQHYIKIWSDQGTDLVRYRFRDLSKRLRDCNGNQVHRSWWVDLDSVQSFRQTGRKLELTIGPDLTIPVSQSYKNTVLAILERN